MGLEGVVPQVESAVERLKSFGLVPGEALRCIATSLDRLASIFNFKKVTLALTAASLLTACSNADYIPSEDDYEDPNRVERMIGEYHATQAAAESSGQEFGQETPTAEADNQVTPETPSIRRPAEVTEDDTGVFSVLEREGFTVDQMRSLYVIIYYVDGPQVYDFDHLLAMSPGVDPGDDLLILSNFDNADYQLPAENVHTN